MKKLLFILLGFISLNVLAVNPTQGPLQQDPSLCSYGYNPNCHQGGRAPAKIIRYTTVNLPSKYGALAFSEKGGNIGGSLNKDSKYEAMRSAKAQCEKGSRGHPCEVITWVRNGCVAAAIGTLGKKPLLPKLLKIQEKLKKWH